MKLMLCPICSEVLRLMAQLRHCRCGASCGREPDDEGRAEIGGYAIAIGVADDPHGKVEDEGMHASVLEHLSAHVIPEDGTTISRIECLAR